MIQEATPNVLLEKYIDNINSRCYCGSGLIMVRDSPLKQLRCDCCFQLNPHSKFYGCYNMQCIVRITRQGAFASCDECFKSNDASQIMQNNDNEEEKSFFYKKFKSTLMKIS